MHQVKRVRDRIRRPLRQGCLTLAGASTGLLAGFFAARFFGLGPALPGAVASSPSHGQASLRAAIASVIPASFSRSGVLVEVPQQRLGAFQDAALRRGACPRVSRHVGCKHHGGLDHSRACAGSPCLVGIAKRALDKELARFLRIRSGIDNRAAGTSDDRKRKGGSNDIGPHGSSSNSCSDSQFPRPLARPSLWQGHIAR